MALVDTGSDPWIREHECCEKLYVTLLNELSDRDYLPKNTEEYGSLSGTIRVHLRQFSNELDQLEANLSTSTTITYEEKERRQRLVEYLRGKHNRLQNMFKENQDIDEDKLMARSAVQGWSESLEEEVCDDVPLLGTDTSVQALKGRQNDLLQKQNEGLDRLSSIISRQKNISITISNEVQYQNELIDDIGTHMENAHGAISDESRHIRRISATDSALGYWIVIILLLCVIIGLSLFF